MSTTASHDSASEGHGPDDYSPPQIHELAPVLALAASDDDGGDTDDAQSPGKYLARPGQLWGGTEASLGVPGALFARNGR